MAGIYERNLVILKSEKEIKEEKGYCKIEIKDKTGKITVSVQGISASNSYELFMLTKKDEGFLGVSLGELKSDAKGKADERFMFNPENVGQTGLKYDKFSIISLAEKSNDRKNIFSVMSGYKAEEIKWIKSFAEVSFDINSSISENESKKNNNVLDENSKDGMDNILNINNEKKEKNEVEEPEKKSVPLENLKTEKNSHLMEESPNKIFNDMVNNFYAEMEELKKHNLIQEDTGIFELAYKETHENEYDELEYMFKHNEQIIPFDSITIKAEWVKINIYELSALNLPISYLKNCFISLGWKKYNYLILGRHKENNSYIYLLGVPDIYIDSNIDIAKELGFTKFATKNSTNTQEGEEGYWIMQL